MTQISCHGFVCVLVLSHSKKGITCNSRSVIFKTGISHNSYLPKRFLHSINQHGLFIKYQFKKTFHQFSPLRWQMIEHCLDTAPNLTNQHSKSYFNINWFELTCQKNKHSFLGLFNIIGLLILYGFQCRNSGIRPINCVCVEFAQCQLLTRDFRWDSCSAPFGLNFIFVAVSFCIGFADDFTMETFVAAPGVLDWVFVFFIGLGLWVRCTWCFPINQSLLAMLDTTSLVDCKDVVFDSLEQWNLDITSGGEHVTTPTPTGKTFNFFPQGIFISFDLPFSSPEKPTTNLFVDCDFGCALAMTRSIMRMICIVCKSDSLLTTHLTPLVIGVSSTKPFCGTIWNKWYQFYSS